MSDRKFKNLDDITVLSSLTKWGHRFSAFWLRSMCSICSYQLNIWYEDHVFSSISNRFLTGDGLSEACFGSVTGCPCIAVPQGSATFPTYAWIQFGISTIRNHMRWYLFLFLNKSLQVLLNQANARKFTDLVGNWERSAHLHGNVVKTRHQPYQCCSCCVTVS